MASILVVDDDELIRLLISEYLLLDKHVVTLADSISAAQNCLAQQLPEIVITDLIMPEQPGTELIKYIKNHYPDMPIIAISGGDRRNAQNPLPEARNLGAEYVLAKPISLDKLRAVLQEILAARI